MHPLLILLAGMLVVIAGILALRLHAFLALLLGALTVAVLTSPEAVERYALGRGLSAETASQLAHQSVGERLATGFGHTTGQVGIVIAMASIIGICLLESGAADRLVRSALYLLGAGRTPIALTGTSFILAVPVFFDTVFYLMVPLAKAARLRTGKSYLFYILAIVAGGTIAHSLVPPTPGPLFVAGELSVDLGTMILGGLAVGLLASSAGYIFARWADSRIELPLRESTEELEQLKKIAQMDESGLPPAWFSALPIVLPVALIAGRTMSLSLGASEPGTAKILIDFFGDKNIALTAAAAIGLVTLFWKRTGPETLLAIKKALSTAGVIILIIGAGGAFGSALQQTGIGIAIQEATRTYQLSILVLAFVLTALIRTAQGSATVAMITAAGTFTALADPAQLGYHSVYLALAIGCGSKPIWWMNDSGFWVITEMSGMKVSEALKTLTPMTAIMGVVGLLGTLVAAWLVPLV